MCRGREDRRRVGVVRREDQDTDRQVTIDRFFALVRILANQGWVRYYLHMLPGQMVLEFAMPIEAPAPDRLNQDLSEQGFRVLDCPQDFPSLRIYRWAVARTEEA